MKPFLILLLLSTFFSSIRGENVSRIESTGFETAEGIGEYLSVVLIKRGEIGKTPISVNINEMFPNEDLLEFKDSPAELILSMLKGYQVFLPISWAKLLKNADSLNLSDNATYLKTFFFQTSQDKYKSVAVLEKGSSFYTITYEVLIWENNRSFLLSVDDTIKVYDSINSIIEDFFATLFELDNESLSDLEEVKYDYGEIEPIEIKSVEIPSFEHLVREIEISIKKKKGCGKLMHAQLNKDLEEVLNENWIKLVLFIQENRLNNLHCYRATMNNIAGAELGGYSVILDFKFKNKAKTYTFSCIASLKSDKWNLESMSKYEEESEPEFRF